MFINSLYERLNDIAQDGYAIGLGFSTTGKPASHVCTYDKGWQDFYWENSLIYSDPVISFGSRNLGAVRWCDIKEDKTQRNALNYARDFNLRNGLMISVQVDGIRAIAGIATSSRVSDTTIREARSILAAIQAHECEKSPLKLTKQQKEILRLISSGASVAATAHKLDITESTVNFHKSEALKANDGLVSNYNHLIAKANRDCLI